MNIKKLDGSFNITVNGMPYNTLEGDKYFNDTLALFNSNPELFDIETVKVKTLDELKSEKIAELKANYDSYLASGFSYNGNYFNIDEVARANLKTKIEVCEDLTSNNYTWRNNSGINIDFINKAGLETLSYQFCLGAENAKLKKFSLKDDINNATIETIDTITITF